jgi:hypothetical protein
MSNVNQAMKKSDNIRKYPEAGDKTYDLAKKYAKVHLWKILHQPIQVGDADYNGAAASGIIGKKSGFPKTKEFLLSKPFDEYQGNIDYIPINLSNTKDEYLCPEDFDANKIRLVDCTDKCFIAKQKLLYGAQNEAMKSLRNETWCKYGFVKQYGGFNSLMIDFESCSLTSESDCRGWDRCFVSDDVYELRNEGLQLPNNAVARARLTEVRDYVTYYSTYPIRCFPNGQIVQFDHGNPSGQNNTTPDNMIGHTLISMDLAINVWFHKYKRFPTYEEVMENFVVAIYSDDKIFGLRPGSSIDKDDYLKIESEVYGKYGMVIKAAVSGVYEHVPGTRFTDENAPSFLGSKAKWDSIEECYVPVPRVNKLATSLTKQLVLQKKELTPAQQFHKLLSICGMCSAAPEILKPAIEFVNWMINAYPENQSEFYSVFQTLDPQIRTEYMELSSKYLITGNESKCGGFFLIFLPPHGWLEGFKDLLMPRSGRNKSAAKSSNKRAVRVKQPRPAPKVVYVDRPVKQRRRRRQNGRSKMNNEIRNAAKEGKEWWETALDVAGKVGSVALPLIAGFGDYEVEQNSISAAASDGKLGNEVPMISNSKCYNIIHHREYIGDILSSTASFTTQHFHINPGMAETFPWLSLIANNYEQYRLRGAIFEVKSLGSSYSASAGLGYVAMATQYNSLSPEFVDLKSLLNHEFANSAKTSETFVHPIECKKSELVLSELYTRPGLPPANSDLRMYDLGKLTVANGGQAVNGQVIGQLYVTYEVELYTPKTSSTSGVNISYFSCTGYTLGTGYLPVIGSSYDTDPATNLGLTFDPTGTWAYFPNGTRGRFAISCSWRCLAPTVAIDPLFLSTPSVVLAGTVGTAFRNDQIPEIGATATLLSAHYVVDVLGDVAGFEFSAPPGPYIGAQGSLRVTQIPMSQLLTKTFMHKHFPSNALEPKVLVSPTFHPDPSSDDEEEFEFTDREILKIMERIKMLEKFSNSPKSVKDVTKKFIEDANEKKM